MSGPDAVWLIGVRCRCRVGVPAAERARPQTILLDVGVSADLARPGRSDRIEDAIDYHALERRLRASVEAGECLLLERLAERAADAALAFSARVRSVLVRARKRPAAMPGAREVVVEICRSRRRKSLAGAREK